MRIAINTRFLMRDNLEGVGYFIRETFGRLASAHPEHEFIFIFDRPYSDEFLFAPNVQAVVTGPPARHPLLWKLWFDIRIPLLLKKIRADVFVSPDGYASLTTRLPQCLVVHDLGFLHHPEAYKKNHVWFLRRNMKRFLRKAQAILTVSQFSKNDLINQYRVEENKIDVVFNGSKEVFGLQPDEVKEEIRKRYTEGREFFVYAGAIQPRKNLVNLLKGFSLFKKRQKSNWKLVLAGRLAWKNDEFLTLLKTYKYREDVVLTGYLPEEELARLVGSAYAMVYPSLFEGFGVPVLESMQCGVPVLTTSGTAMQEIAGEAAFYFDGKDPASIGEAMMRIYKDEEVRAQLIEKGKQQAALYSWDLTASRVWDSILKAYASRKS